VVSFIVLFFFFQAEDGIRAFHVTGVQTCALPICSSSLESSFNVAETRTCPASIKSATSTRATPIGIPSRAATSATDGDSLHNSRSEERRVGKECRTRRTPEAYKDTTRTLHRAQPE